MAADGPGHAHMDPAQAYDAAKLGIWTFLATEVLLFGGLFTAYIVFRLKFPQMFRDDHVHLNRLLGAANTIVLICSSLTVALGIAAIRRGKQGLLKLYLSMTILLAAVFLGIKYVEWMDKFAHGLFPDTDVFFSLYFVMTGLHAIHMIIGLGIMIWMFVWAYNGTVDKDYASPIEISGLYWHFVDIVWIFLFPLLYLIGRHVH
jgi:cytochrome c oxidase subunit 3